VDFNIIPFESAGPIRFGMTPEEVRQVLPYAVRTSCPRGRELYDSFEEIENVVEYHQQGGVWRCTAVHLSYPSNPIFQGRSLLELEDEDQLGFLAEDIFGIIEWLKSIDSDFVDTMPGSNFVGQNLHEDSILFKNLGILLHQQPGSTAEISIYAKHDD
jgi:hypothetical protein